MAEINFCPNPKHNTLIGIRDNTYLVCKLTIVKYFDMLTMWGDVWPDI